MNLCASTFTDPYFHIMELLKVKTTPDPGYMYQHRDSPLASSGQALLDKVSLFCSHFNV